MTDHRDLGNLIARAIINHRKPLYEATLRHTLANDGFDMAVRLACRLLEITNGEALQLIGWLSRTTSHHIHKPREWSKD